MLFLKQSTAVTVKIGPFVDSSDGVTAETALTIQKANVRLSKNGGNFGAANADQGVGDAGAAHDELGYYDISLDTTDTNTLGRLKLAISDAAAVPVWQEFTVLAANVFDSMIGGSDSLEVDAEAIADAVWDEVLTGATHNTPTTAGRRLREIGGSIVHADTAQGPGTNDNQIQLANAASSIDGSYDPSLIAIVNGTGIGQCRLILEYDGATRTATVDRSWKVNPDETSEYVIYANPGREHVNEGLATAGATSTITLNALASTNDDAYKRQIVFIRSGNGEDQCRLITSYDGTTKVATVDQPWSVIPDTTSGYVILPNHVLLETDVQGACNDAIADAGLTSPVRITVEPTVAE
jgi:hypothetical protein